MTDEEQDELENKLRPQLTDEFLATLVDAARTCGWMEDYIAVEDFVKWAFNVVDKKAPSLEPYNSDYKGS
jgi:hypothetical protein